MAAMDGSAVVSDDQLDPPPHIFERLRQIPGYTWDESLNPFHSTYDNWHLFGTRFVSLHSTSTSTPGQQGVLSPSSTASWLPTPTPTPVPALPSASAPVPRPPSTEASSATLSTSEGASDRSATSPYSASASASEVSAVEEQTIVARISYHVLRLERIYNVAKNLQTATDEVPLTITPVDIIRLTPQPGDRGPIVVMIYRTLGPNHLHRVMDLGPAFYYAKKVDDHWVANRRDDYLLDPPISLLDFLDFAIGAAQCLETLHHGHGMVHGEIRGDAFHFSLETREVKLVSFGSGVRSFEYGLTSMGWSTLSKELGAKNKLVYMSPEQTGRMPAEPDARTDIYSLGVLFWQLLTQQPVFTGVTALDVVQCVLGRRIPIVSNVRMDIPDVLGKIIQKCTAKSVQDRYHSATGLRHDLQMVQKFLGDGDVLALKEWRIGAKDISAFFMLPTAMIGRYKERAELVKIIERVARSHNISNLGNINRWSDGSNLSNDFFEGGDGSSEGASSVEGGIHRRSGSFSQTISSDPRQSRNSFHPSFASGDSQTIGGETMSSGNSAPSGPRLTRAWERHQSISMEGKSLVESFSDRQASRASGTDGTSTLSRKLGSAKFRRRGHCEVIILEGAGGLGKSFLVQSVLAEARRRGYCASAKFDNARQTAFGPLLKVLSSLFKQVWGERNTETPLHLALKDYVRPIWPMLHKVLGLPEFLLGQPEPSVVRSVSSAQSSTNGRNIRASLRRRGSSPGSSPGASQSRNSHLHTQISHDYLRGGASTKTIRLMNTFLDILRIFTTYNFICFCLDDLHFADEESLELVTQMISARLNMVIILTYRPDEISPERIQQVLQATAGEDPSKHKPRLNKIVISPLTESEVIQFVASTLMRPPEEVAPLALVIQSKTAGNPFYMREMLSVCHSKKCIWFDHRESRWRFDLDKLFDEFRSEHGYDILDTNFVTQRLGELPPASRSILAWAALLGNSFSFDLIHRLLGGEFHYLDESCPDSNGYDFHTVYTKQEAVAGLNTVVMACIIVQSESDDRFRFAHDRYIQASAQLKECNIRKMHFIIAQTLLKYHISDRSLRQNLGTHICESVNIIKRRLHHRQPFRKHLMEVAGDAVGNGARPTAAKFYTTAISLLQTDPWAEQAEDVDYEESLQLYLRAAECYVYMGNEDRALELTQIVFDHAKTPEDRAPAWMLKARVASQNGDASRALADLKHCLSELEITFDASPSYEKCDAEFMRLTAKVKSGEVPDPTDEYDVIDPKMVLFGAVFAETISAAWWSDHLEFYNFAVSMIRYHVDGGNFPHSSLAFIYFAMIALCRFKMVDFASDLGSQSVDLLDKAQEPYLAARNYMMYGVFISHIQVPLAVAVNHLEQSLELAATAGDRVSILLSFGLSAQMRFYASENYADLEASCQFCCEEIPGWQKDTRGGVFLSAVRQVSRALQGKTRFANPLEVLSDAQHDSIAYKSWLNNGNMNGGRSILIYESMEIIPLYLYGHYEQACEVGQRCIAQLDLIWSARNTRSIILFYGLATAGLFLRKLNDPRNKTEDLRTEIQEIIQKLEGLNKQIKDWQGACDVNYLVWSKWLDAQIAELQGHHGAAIQQYETALDHASEHDFVFEEALGNFLLAGLFIRRSARRSASAVLKESVVLWRHIGAIGMASRIEEDHALLLHGPTRNLRTVEAGVQTDFAGDSGTVTYRVDGEDIPTQAMSIPIAVVESGETRAAAWRGSAILQPEAGAGLPTLDMIDLHAILVSSQVISSVLKVDELLKTMCDVILQTCGSSATQAAIVVQDEEEASTWCVAASGDPEKGAKAHKPPRSVSGNPSVAENVILYCTRFREVVFIPNLLNDERFGNVGETWLQRNPLSRAIIAIPICHGSKPLLGVLYLEGEPGSFTDRNVTVLQLLVNQIGISYSNALSMKSIEKVSAENTAMVELQKKMLTQALEAETKAKNAEAEANRNVKIAEEAAKAKSIFLANVSHELRTPLNGVIGNSELLRDSKLNPEQTEMAESIRVSADLLLTVINDILDFSKMEADKMKLHIIAFNPEEMVREVVRAVSYSNREKTSTKNVKIIQDIALPSMLIYGDPIRLHQVLGNLISNSLKFTDNGSITIGARLDSDTPTHTKLTFWVKDTGIGIPPQQLAKLFKPFSQADASTARKYGGSGLGLSICKSLIETMMKGRIELESEENVGTIAWFTVTFDKAKPEVSAGDVQTVSVPQIIDRQATPAQAQKDNVSNPYLDLTQVRKEDLRICIAEDNAINQKIAIQYVRKLGYTKVDAYDNGLKAVEGLREKSKEGSPYHVVLMDVQMPILDGYEATKLLRKDPDESVKKVLVIAMTASAIQGDREKCLAAGMNDYLAKPVKADILKKKLDTYINGQMQSSPLRREINLTDGPSLPANPVPVPNQLSPVPSPPSVMDAPTNGSPPFMEIPVRDNPAYSIPSGPPMAPSRTSSDNRSSIGSMTETTAASVAGTTAQQSIKRQPRKLTKAQGYNPGETPSPPPDKLERTKGVLKKTRRPSLVPSDVSVSNENAQLSSVSIPSEDGRLSNGTPADNLNNKTLGTR